MTNERHDQDDGKLTITYATIKDLCLFQEQYSKLTDEIQQAMIQLENSPAIGDDSPRAKHREEWRSWLQLQIASKQRMRADLVKSLQDEGIIVDNLPE